MVTDQQQKIEEALAAWGAYDRNDLLPIFAGSANRVRCTG
jgi:hypothetical protein